MGRKRKHQPASNASLSPLKKPVGASRDAEAQRGDVVPPTLQIVACTANDALRDVLSSGQWELSCCSHSCNCQTFTLQAEGLLCANCSHRAAAHKLAVKQLAGPVVTQRLQQLFVHVRNLRAAAAYDNTACWGRSWGSQHVQKMLAAACQLAAALSATLHDAASAVRALQTAQALTAQQHANSARDTQAQQAQRGIEIAAQLDSVY
eukprot:6092-Heterococcus_DN1.PRE.1